MALRALDNTMPAAVEERPKKVAKVAAPAGAAAVKDASPGSGGKKKKKNDENSAPRATAAAGEQAVEYIPSEELEAAAQPKAKAAGLVAGLDSKDWIRACEALNDARRLAIHHSALLKPILEKVMLAIVKTMKSPRSAVLKTSIMACTDIFNSFGNLLSSVSDDTFDKLLLQLLLKASQDKRFVCEEAEKAMRAMAASMPPLPLLKKLKAYVHHANLRVRAKAAVSISHCAARMDIEAMKEFGMSALLQVAAELLNDRLPEAREAARSVVGSMHGAFAKEAAARGDEGEDAPSVAASWESLCSLSLPPISAQAVAKIAASQ
ncbi:hypothetical protein C2845_PM07G33760 [Panicum miliaceum]|uniref:TOG domain-containing protein n=1 Tax=Panicum miliaceum TaxID=4540 RepID=A0A3L6SU66_PANMI|nr:hypothetical protein C2845_PM07G33760 [Panicum miliaceum]